MGITTHTLNLIKPFIYPGINYLDFGSQIMYLNGRPEISARDYFTTFGVNYDSIDLNGEYGAMALDLSKIINLNKKYDIVVDAGTGEHIGGGQNYNSDDGNNYGGNFNINSFYNFWVNKFSNCKIEGHIISENPLKGNWPGHGFNYIDKEFYTRLNIKCDIDILDLGIHPAMENTIDGWNVFCVIKKTGERFISLNDFKQLGVSNE